MQVDIQFSSISDSAAADVAALGGGVACVQFSTLGRSRYGVGLSAEGAGSCVQAEVCRMSQCCEAAASAR